MYCQQLHSVAYLLVLVVMSLGCDGRVPPTGPSPPAAPAPPAPPAAPPVITAISPSTGSTGGDTHLIITGTGFRPGANVAVDGITIHGGFDSGTNAATFIKTPPHAAGTVDVVVTNTDGQSHRLAGGYTYAPPESFDFNGTWSGFGDSGRDFSVGFTIENNALISMSCNTSPLTFSPAPLVGNGEFSFSRDDGVVVSGRVVAATAAVGTINFADCTAHKWTASKQ